MADIFNFHSSSVQYKGDVLSKNTGEYYKFTFEIGLFPCVWCIETKTEYYPDDLCR